MRKIIYIITALALLFPSCKDVDYDDGNIPEGIPTTITLTTQVDNGTVHTRAFSSDEAEKTVNNLFVLIFNATTKKVISTYFFDNLTPTTTSVTLSTLSGSNRNIYAIANIELGMMDVTKSKMQAITTIDELNAFVTTISQNTLGRGTSFIMSGFIADPKAPNQPASIDVTTTGNKGSISLKRLDSKITFNVTSPASVTFTPRDWRVCNVQRSIALFNSSVEIKQDTCYFNSDWTTFEGTGETFSFYALENIHTPQKQITVGTNDYFYREKQIKESIPADPSKPNQSVRNGAFEYAPLKGTYVQMRCNIKYTDPQDATKTISSDLTLTVHLGYVNSAANDYNNNRNTKYIYNVSFNSAGQIILEVDSSDPTAETQPGTDGEVILSNVIYHIDSHYKSVIATFDKSVINDLLSWYVRTPFSEGSPSKGSQNLTDYKWVHFKLNPLLASGAYSSDILAYPGDTKIYKGDLTVAAYEAELAKADNVRCDMLDVDQLVKLLRAYKAELTKQGGGGVNKFDSQDDMTFTAFVDEFYYYANPNDGTAPVDLWKQFANQPERMLSLTTVIKYSPDGGIVKSEALYAFRQNSIQTMYNVNYNNPTETDAMKTAWGAEMNTEETSARAFGTAVATTSQRNGRANTLLLWKVGDRWDKYVDPVSQENKTGYVDVRYACMKRNRDNNGNGLIDATEVKWYLASINQLRDMWIGENSIDIRTRLYDGPHWGETWEGSDPGYPWGEKLYASSSPYTGGAMAVLWSAEGASVSSHAVSWLAEPKKFYARCVRNLGIADNSSAESQDFASYDAATGVMSLERLDRRSIRTYTQQAELPEHNERQADNLPWWKFMINPATSGSLTFTALQAAASGGTSPCKEITIGGVVKKFRVPNQRELVLMQSRLGANKDGNDGHWGGGSNYSRTTFSFNVHNGTTGRRHGFSVNENGILLRLLSADDVNALGGTRCVQDLPYTAPR